jgi:acetyltransferase-like isoleucine patch superfamily enzyme
MVQAVYNEILRHIPDRLGNRPRQKWLQQRGTVFGANAVIARGSRVLDPSRLWIGDGVVVARDVTLDARGGLTIKAHALIGFESVLLTHTHRADRIGVPVQAQGMYDGPVVIGERAWLGTRVVVLPGVTVGEDSIVAAGAVVVADVPPRAIVGGVPARVLKDRG